MQKKRNQLSRYLASSKIIKRQQFALITSGLILTSYSVISLIYKSVSITFLAIFGASFLSSLLMIVLGKILQRNNGTGPENETGLDTLSDQQ